MSVIQILDRMYLHLNANASNFVAARLNQWIGTYAVNYQKFDSLSTPQHRAHMEV